MRVIRRCKDCGGVRVIIKPDRGICRTNTCKFYEVPRPLDRFERIRFGPTGGRGPVRHVHEHRHVHVHEHERQGQPTGVQRLVGVSPVPESEAPPPLPPPVRLRLQPEQMRRRATFTENRGNALYSGTTSASPTIGAPFYQGVVTGLTTTSAVIGAALVLLSVALKLGAK